MHFIQSWKPGKFDSKIQKITLSSHLLVTDQVTNNMLEAHLNPFTNEYFLKPKIL